MTAAPAQPRRPRRRPRSAAFTLLEVVTAMVVVAVILPVAMQGISTAMRLEGEGRRRTDAATLAHAKLEEMVATAGWQTGDTDGDFADSGFPDYRWSVTAGPWNDTTMYEVDLEVTWTSDNQERSMTMGTLVDVGGF